MKITYPAIFRIDKEDPTWINVSFPDIIAGVTCGRGMDNAIYMAKDLLKLMYESAKEQCLPPHTLLETQANFPNEDVRLIEIEIDE